MKVELKVKPVTRYIVTKYTEAENTGSVSTVGEYENPDVAYEVGYAIARQEQERLGYSPGDERIQFPIHPNHQSVNQVINIAGALDERAMKILKDFARNELPKLIEQKKRKGAY